MTGDHFLRGFLLSAALNGLAVAAALAVSLRARLAGRAELALATIMTWNFLVMCPVYVLGLSGHLQAGTLALTSAPFFLLVCAAARGRTPLREFASELGMAAVRLVVMPVEAIALCARSRSLVTLGVLFTFALLGWTLWCAYLTPAWKQWDALWYHEPMVGFAIQNHGFAMVDLPQGGAQKINGYPRLCEMTQLWFVIFTDRRVIDMVGHVAMPGLALSVYLMARRYGSDAVVAIALACCLVLMPACLRLLGSTYVDAHNAAFILGGAHFATRSNLRLRDALFATACLALAVASKAMALVPVGVLGVIAAVRLLLRARGRALEATGIVALGFLVIGAAAATVYWRNWVHFGNPFWPDLKYDNDRWGIHWPGAVEWGEDNFEKGESRIDMNLPLADLLAALYRIPYSVPVPHYDQLYEYGLAMTWVAFPLAAVALVALSVALVRDAVAVLAGRPQWRVSEATRNAALIAVTLMAIVRFSPALWGARYQIAAAGLALGLVAWAAGRASFHRLGEGVAGALIAMSFVSFVWATPRGWLKWSEALAFARIPYPMREFTPASVISPSLEIWNGSPVTPEVGTAREKQLGPGAVLAFPDWYGIYMALFWNNEFSNRVLYVPSGPNYLERLMRTDAVWAYCGAGDTTCSALGDPGSGWEVVGTLDVERRGKVYRRVRW